VTERAVFDLVNSLAGIASCATSCGCCAMHREIAAEALAKFQAATGITPEAAYQGARAVARDATP
jgi:hypothetical protein